ncbi:hypothetical protein EV182_000274 [Spiromyces aspiralis]|uniref:Uncharacterized protein n=1 Tax=Spiromyces aspiralis TaxID=68401 RepID=A0ACC1HIB2_9FUNG|nr:hypothetical protein EV182_000274 [Spiromyces aspiralis]
MSRSNNPISDEKQRAEVLISEGLTYEVFNGLRDIIIKSLSKVDRLEYLDELLLMEKGTFDRLSVRRALLKAWPNMDVSTRQEVFNTVCGPTQEGATPKEGTPGPADVREVTEAMGDTEPDQDYELEAEKARLAQEICARIETKPLRDILCLMGGIDDYYKFIREHGTEIKELMHLLPKELAGKNEEEQQAAFMPFLERLIDMANEIWRPKDPTPESPRQYYLYDTHKNPPIGTRLKPDALVSTDINERLDTAELVVEFKQNEDRGDITTKGTQSIYGQLGVYARRVWARQPMRRFVPVLLVHELRVTLFLFTRGKVYRTKIGSAIAGRRSNEAVVGHLLFLLSGNVSNFGVVLPSMSDNDWAALFSSPCQHLFCQRLGIEVDDKAIIRRRRRQQQQQQHQQQPTSPRPDNHPTTSHFEVDNVARLSQPDLFGRIAFLARGTFVDSDSKRTKAVLKFVRREVIRQAEGEAYGVLRWKGVPHVPELLLSGYADEWDSGVLECLVVADVGRSLRDCLIDDVKKRRDPKLLKRVATVVTQCLVAASEADVHHRDISIGNICVDEDGTVRVIDWGCARVEPETLQAYRKKLMVDFPGDPSLLSLPDADEVAGEEKKHDPFTGTPHFLSVRVLLRYTLRSVVDDIESLLYVLVYFVAKDTETFRNAPLCRKGLTEEELALKKASAFTCLNHFHKWAGLNDLDLDLSQRDQECFELLKTFIERLFFDKESATSMLSSLLNDEDDPRKSYDSEYWLISGS